MSRYTCMMVLRFHIFGLDNHDCACSSYRRTAFFRALDEFYASALNETVRCIL